MKVTALGSLGAFGLPSFDRHGAALVVVFAAKSFALPPPSSVVRTPVALPEQPSPPRKDQYWGEVGASSLRAEAMSAYVRVGTDIWASGAAWSPRGRACTEVELGLRVGPCTKVGLVTGERRWVSSPVGARASQPESFESLPVIYERAFGGTSEREQCAQNPVGRGVHASAAAAIDQPLPNIEAFDGRVESPRSRVMPLGFGPIPRHWQPRVGFAGTYDQNWIERRAPLWPEDMDLRLFSSASTGLSATAELRGPQPVVAQGWSPDGDYRFELPSPRLIAHTIARTGEFRQRMVLDLIDLRFGDGTLMMVWRSSVRMLPEDHQLTKVRELEPWEADS